MNSSLAVVPRFLRDPATFFDNVRRGRNLEAQIGWLATSSVLCLTTCGFVMGLAHSPWQALSSAVKMPILLLGAGLLSLPALYFFTLALGMPLRMAQVAAVILAGIGVMSLLLLGLSPVMMIFVLTSTCYPFFQLLTLASVAVSGCVGVWYVWRGMARVYLFNDRVPTSVRRVLMGAWFTLYAFVGSQMAWRLSPFVGDPALPFFLLQPSRDNLYVAVIHALERVLGQSLPSSITPPVWITGLCLILFLLVFGVGLVSSAEET